MSRETTALRAVAARGLLNDPTIQEAFAAIEADLTDEWKRTHIASERENLWLALNVMEKLKSWLQSAASHDMQALRRVK